MKCRAALLKQFLIPIAKMLLCASLPRCCLRSCLHSSLTGAMPGPCSLLAWTLAWLSLHRWDPSASLPLCIAYVLPAGCPQGQGVTQRFRGPGDGQHRLFSGWVLLCGSEQPCCSRQPLTAGFVHLQPRRRRVRLSALVCTETPCFSVPLVPLN